MTPSMLALRGATTLDVDTAEQMDMRVGELLREMFERNDLSHDNVVDIFFTGTPDIHSKFPALSAREAGINDIPLIGAQELDVENGLQYCVRVLAHVTLDISRDRLRHVYLHGARSLRPDLSE